MAYGTWGSRIPIGNLLFSSVVRLGIVWRLASRRLTNRIRRAVFPRPVVTVDNPSARDELERWLGAGYDKLNVGGGPKNLAGFVNVDFVRHANVAREICANILDLSFVPTGCMAQIHSNHVVEHLSRDQLVAQLREYVRILRPGGLLTVRCPNALGAVYAFWFPPVHESDREAFVADGFPAEEDFGDAKDGWLHKDFYGTLHWLYGDAGNVENEHLNQLTPSSLTGLIRGAGLVLVRASAPEAINLVVVARKPAAESNPAGVGPSARPAV
jgi:SAM-dependent methyltransferase